MKFLSLVCIFSYALLLSVTDANESLTTVDPSECPEKCACTYTNSSQIYVNVDCSSLELDEVPQGTFDKTYRLYLNDNNITILNNDTFNEFLSVHTLDLKRNVIEYIDTWTFMEFRNLVLLDLSDNRITTINFGLLVRTLILDRNPLVLENDTPVPIDSVVSQVSFLECDLKRISRNSLKQFRDASIMDLSENSIENIAGIFQDLKILGELRLSSNKITTVEANDFAGLGNLRRLSLAKNPLQSADLEGLNVVLAIIGHLDISDTDLVCECQHEYIKSWAKERRINLTASCEDDDICVFPTTVPATPPPKTNPPPIEVCGDGPACVDPEFCCEDLGKCSEKQKCGAAGLAALPVSILLLLAVVLGWRD